MSSCDTLYSNIIEATPSFLVRAILKGETQFETKLGSEYQIYDIASLTKVVYTTTRFMELVSDGQLGLDKNVREILPSPLFDREGTVRQLLTHSLGHRWWAPFYEDLKGDEPYLANQQWDKLKKLLSVEKPVAETDQYIYSDVDFLFLGLIIEELTGKSLFADFESFKQRWGLVDTFFSADNQCPVDVQNIAPTEHSVVWNKRMHGQVHDENTYSLGGVSSHAGLFSSIKDLSCWFLKLRSCYLGESSLVDSKVVRSFFTRQTPKEKGDWALGYMMPTEGSSSCGELFSSSSVGHTGFTGTSFWYDPAEDLAVIILSNRVYNGRENKKFVKLRGPIHSAVYKKLVG